MFTQMVPKTVQLSDLHYPRFQSDRVKLKSQALELAHELMYGLDQCRVSVDFPDETLMLTNGKYK
jgi:hypothetical protein